MASGDEIITLSSDDLANVLHEREEGGPGGNMRCSKCGSSEPDCVMVRRTKCFPCHVIHLLLYGESLWKDIVADASDSFLSNRTKLVEMLKEGQIEIPDGWKPDQKQLVLQEKFVNVVTRSLGSTRVFTHESYKRNFGRDPVQDDSLQAEDFKTPGGNTVRAFKVFHGPRDAWEIHHEEHTRSLYRRVLDGGEVSLAPDQQHARFLKRSQMTVEPFEFAKVPDEKTAPPASSGVGSAPGNSAAPLVAMDTDPDDDPNERLALGLNEDAASKKRKSVGGGGPRVKKSREEVFSEEVTKLEAKCEEILTSLTTSSPAGVQAINHLLKASQKKLEDSKKAGLFDSTESVEALVTRLSQLREAVKATGQYLPASGLPAKKHEEAFLKAMTKLPVSMRQRFSVNVQDHFLHVSHVQDLAQGHFMKAVENIREFRGEEKNMISMVELLLARVVSMAEDLDPVRKQLKEVVGGLTHALGSDNAADFTEDMAENLKLLRQLVFEDLGDQGTFDVLLTDLEGKVSEPILRAVLKERHGVTMLDQIRETNKALQTRATKALKVHNVKASLSQLDLLEVVKKAASLNITSSDLEMVVLAKDYNDICQEFSEKCGECTQSAKEGLAAILLDFSEADKIPLKEMQAFLLSSARCELIDFHNARMEIQDKLMLGKADAACKFDAREMQCLCTLVSVLEPFFHLMEVTAAENKGYNAWAASMVDHCLEATGGNLQQVTKKVWNLCEAINALPDMKDLSSQAESCFGKWASDCVAMANKVVTTCVPEFLGKLVKKCEDQLLRSQSWFQEKCGNDLFLPADQPMEFWDRCAQWAVPQDLKASVDGMAATLAKLGQPVDLPSLTQSFAEHTLQFHACLCRTSMNLDLVNCPMSDIKNVVNNVAGQLVEASRHFKGANGEDAVPKAKEWFARHVTGPLFGDFLTRFVNGMSQSLAAVPEGIDVMVTNKNAARLRQVLFEKKTHEACAGQNENYACIMQAFDKVLSALGNSAMISATQLAKLKSAQQQWKRLRTYASTVAAANLLLNKFLGKPLRDRAALLREFRKKLDKGGVQISKSLMTWLSEEASTTS